jgi:hypothetical protein
MNSNIVTADRYLTIRAKAFSNQGVQTHRIKIDADLVLPLSGGVVRGTVRVWDDVAGHFTTCHILSARTIAKIRRTFQA